MAGLDEKMRKFIRERVPKLSTAELQEQVKVSGKFARKKGMSAGAIDIHLEAVRQSTAELAQRGVSVAKNTAGKRRRVGM
jgi:hypothetical protein